METNTPQMVVPMAGTPTPATGSMPPNATPAVPVIAKIISVLFYIASIAFIFLGIMAAFLSSLNLSVLGSFGVNYGLLPGGLSIAWGIISFFAARGLWSGQQYGRIAAITISALYIIFVVITIFTLGSANYISLVVNFAIILYLLFSKDVRAAFVSTKPIGLAIVLAVLAVLVYAAMEYPNLTPKQTAMEQALSQMQQISNQLKQNQSASQNPVTNSNPANEQAANSSTPPSSNTSFSNPAYGPVVQGLTRPGIYSNTYYGFQMNIPFAYSVQSKQGSPAYLIYINMAQGPAFYIWTAPTTLSLQDMIKQDMGDLITGDNITNTTIAGEPAEQDQNSYGRNNFYLIHNGNYYRFNKAGQITADQFNSAVESLKFNK